MALGSTQLLTQMSTRYISWELRRTVRKADNLTTILCRCHEIWGNLTSSNPLAHSRPVTGLLYLFNEILSGKETRNIVTGDAKNLKVCHRRCVVN